MKKLITGLIVVIVIILIAVITLTVATVLVAIYSRFLKTMPFLAVLIGIIIYAASVVAFINEDTLKKK